MTITNTIIGNNNHINYIEAANLFKQTPTDKNYIDVVNKFVIYHNDFEQNPGSKFLPIYLNFLKFQKQIEDKYRAANLSTSSQDSSSASSLKAKIKNLPRSESVDTNSFSSERIKTQKTLSSSSTSSSESSEGIEGNDHSDSLGEEGNCARSEG